MTATILLSVAYLLGSIPFGILIAKLLKVKDLTHQGSGNIGATNVTRVLGFWPGGALTFALDAGKGALAVFLAGPVGVDGLWQWIILPGYHSTVSLEWCAGMCAVLGHCFSPWLKLRGGKGVATGFGALVLLSPWAALAGIAIFGLTLALKRIGSLASLAGLSVAVVVQLVFEPAGVHLWAGAAMVFVILIRHEKNITDLLAGNEKLL